MDYPIFELKISENIDDDAEVSTIAFVDFPAIKKDFLQFVENTPVFNTGQNFAIQNEDKRIVTGALMIPDQLIYRKSEKFGEHYVRFSAETIKEIAIKFAKKGFQKNVNLMHDETLAVEGVTMFESFLSDKARGIAPIAAFADLPDGSWFGSFYVENDKVWQLVKDNQLRGFSVEGMFDYVQPKQSDEAKLMELKNIFGQF